MTEAMTSLIDKLSQATGPSRELDAEIALLVGWRRGSWAVETADEGWFEPGRPNVMHVEAPAYTASVDAALTLIPEGLYLDLHDWTWAAEPAWCASLQSTVGKARHISAKAPTPALALMLVALRARAEKETTDTR